MKTLLVLLALLTLVSCGKESSSDPYLFRADLERVWNSVDSKSSQADFTNLNAVVIYGLSKDGISADCTYSVTREEYNDFYGTLNLTYVSGDSFVCSQLTGDQGYQLVKDTRAGKEKLSVGSYKFE